MSEKWQQLSPWIRERGVRIIKKPQNITKYRYTFNLPIRKRKNKKILYCFLDLLSCPPPAQSSWGWRRSPTFSLYQTSTASQDTGNISFLLVWNRGAEHPKGWMQPPNPHISLLRFLLKTLLHIVCGKKKKRKKIWIKMKLCLLSTWKCNTALGSVAMHFLQPQDGFAHQFGSLYRYITSVGTGHSLPVKMAPVCHFQLDRQSCGGFYFIKTYLF